MNKESLWLSAVDWIVFNESHIRLETRQLSGKDFSVWRWIPIDDNDVDGLETQEQVSCTCNGDTMHCNAIYFF